jgi:amino acid transporter
MGFTIDTAIAILLSVVAATFILVILVANIYILAYFSHPHDTNTKGIYFYRIIVVASLCAAGYFIFSIPLDLVNTERHDLMNLGYPMGWIWTGINFYTALTVMFFLPFALITYSDEHETLVYLLLKYIVAESEKHD